MKKKRERKRKTYMMEHRVHLDMLARFPVKEEVEPEIVLVDELVEYAYPSSNVINVLRFYHPDARYVVGRNDREVHISITGFLFIRR